MGLTLGGVELIAPTTELCRWIETNLPVGEALPWVDPRSGGPGPSPLGPFDAPLRGMPREWRVGDLYWPVSSAQRWAYGCFLADAEAAEKIRAAAFESESEEPEEPEDPQEPTTTPDATTSPTSGGDGSDPTEPTTEPEDPEEPEGSPQKLQLQMDDGRALDVLEIDFNLLRLIPLSAVPSDPELPVDDPKQPNNLILIVVVDDRYYWQNTPCPDFGIKPYGSYNPSYTSNGTSTNSGSGSTGSGGGQTTTTPTAPSWKDVIKATTDALGITLDLPTISTDYLSPDPGWNLPGAPAGMMLDALLANVGLRLVANYDGTFDVQGWKDAQEARQTDDASETGQERQLRAGGDQFLDRVGTTEEPTEPTEPTGGGGTTTPETPA